MNNLNLKFPGTWLDYEDKVWGHKVEILLNLVKEDFMESTLAVKLFQKEFALVCNMDQRIIGLYEDVSKESDWENKCRILNQLKEDQNQESITRRILNLYAKMFVYSLDNIYKLFTISMFNTEGIPETVKKAIKDFRTQFSKLHGIRNSLQHIEDRSRLLGPGNKKIITKAVETEFMKLLGKDSMCLFHLEGNKVGCTMANGEYGEIEVSLKTLDQVREMIQSIINDFSWKGPENIFQIDLTGIVS